MKRLLSIILISVLCVNVSFANEIVEDYFYIANNYKTSGDIQKALEYIDYILQIEPNNVDAKRIKAEWLPSTIDKTVIKIEQPEIKKDIIPLKQDETPTYTLTKKTDVKIATTKPETKKAPQKTIIKSEPKVKEVTIEAKKPKIDNQKQALKNTLRPSANIVKSVNSEKTISNKVVVQTTKTNEIKEVTENNGMTSSELQNKALETIKPVVKEPLTYVIPIKSEEVTEKVSYDSNFYNSRGKELYENGEFGMAVEYFYKAIKENPKNYTAYNNLGMVSVAQGNNELAEKSFLKANSIKKAYTQPLINLALLYQKLGNSKKSFSTLNRAISLNPNDFWAYYLIGDYYKDKNCYTKAIENYKEAIQINSSFAQAYLAVAICEFETEDFQASIKTLHQYLTLKPYSDFAYSLLAKNERITGDLEGAKRDLLKAIVLNDTNEYRYSLAKIKFANNESAESVLIFESLKPSMENSAELYNYTGLAYYKLKNIDSAIKNINKAIALDGMRPIYYYNLAQCYKTLGDKKSYTKFIKTATQTNPITTQDFIDLSCIYFDNSNPNFAINTLNKGISKYKKSKALYVAKLKIYGSLGDMNNYAVVKKEIDKKFNQNEEAKKKTN